MSRILTIDSEDWACIWGHNVYEGYACVVSIVAVNCCTINCICVACRSVQYWITKSKFIASDTSCVCCASQKYGIPVCWAAIISCQSWSLRSIWEKNVGKCGINGNKVDGTINISTIFIYSKLSDHFVNMKGCILSCLLNSWNICKLNSQFVRTGHIYQSEALTYNSLFKSITFQWYYSIYCGCTCIVAGIWCLYILVNISTIGQGDHCFIVSQKLISCSSIATSHTA